MLGGFPDVPGQFSLTPLNLGQNDIVLTRFSLTNNILTSYQPPLNFMLATITWNSTFEYLRWGDLRSSDFMQGT